MRISWLATRKCGITIIRTFFNPTTITRVIKTIRLECLTFCITKTGRNILIVIITCLIYTSRVIVCCCTCWQPRLTIRKGNWSCEILTSFSSTICICRIYSTIWIPCITICMIENWKMLTIIITITCTLIITWIQWPCFWPFFTITFCII